VGLTTHIMMPTTPSDAINPSQVAQSTTGICKSEHVSQYQFTDAIHWHVSYYPFGSSSAQTNDCGLPLVVSWL
jgi:hypothetical protein